MAITHLDETVRFPFDRVALESGDPKRATDALLDIITAITDITIRDVITVTNHLIDRTGTAWTYYGVLDTTTGEYNDGAFRVGVVTGALEIQKKVDGTFTKVNRFDI